MNAPSQSPSEGGTPTRKAGAPKGSRNAAKWDEPTAKITLRIPVTAREELQRQALALGTSEAARGALLLTAAIGEPMDGL